MTSIYDLDYQAPNTEEIEDQLRKIRLRMRMSLSPEGIVKGLDDLDLLLRELEEKYLIVQIRYAKNPEDDYWRHQYESFVSWQPHFQINLQETMALLTDNRNEREIAALVGNNAFLLARSLLSSYSPAIRHELDQIIMLKQKYIQMLHKLGLRTKGGFNPGWQLKKTFMHPSRDRRCIAYKRWLLRFNNMRDDLLAIYLEILALQRKITEKMGYARISDYISRNPWLEDSDLAKDKSFAHRLRRYFLPILQEVRRQQAARLGHDLLLPWDQWMPTVSGSPKPLAEANNLDSFMACLDKMFDDESGFLHDAINLSDSALEAKVYERIDRPSFHLPLSDLPHLAYTFNAEGFYLFDLFYQVGSLCADTAAFLNRLFNFSWSAKEEIRNVCAVSVETLAADYAESFYGSYAEDAFDIHLSECLQEIMEAAAITLFEQEVLALENPDGRKLAEIWTKEESRSGLSAAPWDDSANYFSGYKFLLYPELLLNPLQHLTKARAYIRIWSFRPFFAEGSRRLGTALSQLLASDTATSDQLQQAGFPDFVSDLDIKLAAFSFCERLKL